MKFKKTILLSLLCLSSFNSYSYANNNDYRMTYQKDFSNENNLNRSTAINLCEKAFNDVAKENKHNVVSSDNDIYHEKCLTILNNSNIFYSNLLYFNNLYGNINNLTIDNIKDKFILNYIFIKYNANNNILYHNNYIYMNEVKYNETNKHICYGPCPDVHSYEIFDKYNLEKVLWLKWNIFIF